ncbi:NAD(P)H-binding protein [Vallicoccus soli]|uniref:NAD(P)-dependent oxidoreductase n=1 Tax=Vallicoccus soli TaxID=2339232 RepID=A0A3A3Z1J8_9ACTN|nr:NAD(P)H-binding protein [Vallicoccus soli]RJK97053.1 NAD(P)-dependent oxidoreductase [Vallicoccus soli]
MPTYAVTGATGHLGRLVIHALLERGAPAGEVAALVRAPERAGDVAALGVEVREADYDRPGTLGAALSGVRRLLLVSGSEPGRRVPQHRAVVDAAREAGVELLAYTSILGAGRTSNPLAPDHEATEELLAASGVPHALLRNGWYTENYAAQLGTWAATGTLLGAAGDAGVSVAARADYAAAAAAVLAEGRPGDVHELGGPAVDFAAIARAASAVTGVDVAYRSLPPQDYVAALTAAGVDEGTAGFLAALEATTARGELATTSTDLERLAGRPVTPVEDVLRAAWAEQRPAA